jgi:hypothetical protein
MTLVMWDDDRHVSWGYPAFNPCHKNFWCGAAALIQTACCDELSVGSALEPEGRAPNYLCEEFEMLTLPWQQLGRQHRTGAWTGKAPERGNGLEVRKRPS